MPSPRQQRGQNYRGRIQVPNERPAPDAAWLPQTVNGADVVCNIDPETSGWQLSGVPALHCTIPDQMAVSAVLVDNELTVTFPAGCDPLAYFTLRSADGAVRGPFGEFLSAFRGQQVSASVTPFTPTAIVATLQSWLLNDVVLELTPALGTNMLFVQSLIKNVTQPLDVNTIQLSNTQLVLQMTGPNNAGDFVEYPAILLATNTAGLHALAQFTLQLP